MALDQGKISNDEKEIKNTVFSTFYWCFVLLFCESIFKDMVYIHTK